jgi:hypothetical protein
LPVNIFNIYIIETTALLLIKVKTISIFLSLFFSTRLPLQFGFHSNSLILSTII